MTHPISSGTMLLRTEMRRLVTRRVLWFAALWAAGWIVLRLALSLLAFFLSDRRIDSFSAEDITLEHTMFGMWLMAPTFLAGACAVAPDRSSGGPAGPVPCPQRKTAVLAARLLSTLVVVTVLSSVGSVLLAGAIWTGLAGYEAPTTGSGELWRTWAYMLVLTLVLVWATAVLGLSIATVGRRTAAAVVVMALYVGWWDLPWILVSSNPGKGVERSLFSTQANSWLAQPTDFAGSNIGGPLPRVEAGLTITVLALTAMITAFVIEHHRSNVMARRSGGRGVPVT